MLLILNLQSILIRHAAIIQQSAAISQQSALKLRTKSKLVIRSNRCYWFWICNPFLSVMLLSVSNQHWNYAKNLNWCSIKSMLLILNLQSILISHAANSQQSALKLRKKSKLVVILNRSYWLVIYYPFLSDMLLSVNNQLLSVSNQHWNYEKILICCSFKSKLLILNLQSILISNAPISQLSELKLRKAI